MSFKIIYNKSKQTLPVGDMQLVFAEDEGFIAHVEGNKPTEDKE